MNSGDIPSTATRVNGNVNEKAVTPSSPQAIPALVIDADGRRSELSTVTGQVFGVRGALGRATSVSVDPMLRMLSRSRGHH